MNPEDLKNIYFLGIGGIGMSALARYFHRQGVNVSGYDKTSTRLTRQLQQEGIAIHFDDDISKIPGEIDLVVYTPAIPKDLKEFRQVHEKGLNVKKRSEVLGELAKKFKTIAVAGTHGKTTVSTLIAHILYHSAVGCNAFLGGISKNYDSNLLINEKSEWMVTEADEFDRSFLQLFPFIAVITSMDADHLDIYQNYQNLKESFSRFAGQVDKSGSIILKKVNSLYDSPEAVIYNYSLNSEGDYFAENISQPGLNSAFDIVTPEGVIKDCMLGIPGLINIENAVAAIAVCRSAGAGDDEIKKGLASFRGVKRRFDIIFNNNGLIYIDDYAHHPEEIRKLAGSVNSLFPGKKILAIFQPHLYSRTRDFADGFAECLGLFDEVILLPIYPAREQPIAGINSDLIFEKISGIKKSLHEKNEMPDALSGHKFDILLTVGAGDIDQLVDPIRQFLETNY